MCFVTNIRGAELLGGFWGDANAGEAARMIYGHTTTQLQPWNFWLPFPTHWSHHCKSELRNNLSTYTVTDSSLVLDLTSQYSNSMSGNHNIPLERWQEAWHSGSYYLEPIHEVSCQKEKIRIMRRLPSLSQRSVCAQLLSLVIILCQADQTGLQENVNSYRMSLKIHINNGFTVVLLTFWGGQSSCNSLTRACFHEGNF